MKSADKKRITLDYNNVMKEKIGSRGVSAEDIRRIMPLIKESASKIKRKRDDGKFGFMYLPYESKMKDEIKKAADAVKNKFENFVVLGIGGSALGAAAVHRAASHPFYNMLPHEKRHTPRLFVLDNVDPEAAAGIFDVIDIRKTLVNVITKSGDTA
ncbi:MAG TPA: glucose-6-phosphate isomerase, partial [Firmicutes bacterium]|nr:glucose-6-phosphate isomerase [Bacillota bacterium]